MKTGFFCVGMLFKSSEGQNFVMILMALAADGVNLVMKARLFFLDDLIFGLSAIGLSMNLSINESIFTLISHLTAATNQELVCNSII